MIDVDRNGINDCLLLDDRGLKVIETISGEVIWHVHSHEERKTVGNLDFPVKLPDFNSDGVNELLAIYQKRSLLLICGKTGKALTNIQIKNCITLSNLLIGTKIVQFLCQKDIDSITNMNVSFGDLKTKYHNSSFAIKLTEFVEVLKGKESFIIGNRKIIINNSGTCPDCKANIELIELKSDKKKILPYDKAFVMTPKPFHFQSTKSNIQLFKGHITGFILKVWQWSDVKSASKKPSKKSNLYRRNIMLKNDTYFINVINERVILITFNDTSEHIINASLTEIHQLCFPTSKKEEKICQPDIESQENSLLVGDLDQDGSQELISYSSTFIERDKRSDDDFSQHWSLVSNIKLIRLENELPKLYGEK